MDGAEEILSPEDTPFVIAQREAADGPQYGKGFGVGLRLAPRSEPDEGGEREAQQKTSGKDSDVSTKDPHIDLHGRETPRRMQCTSGAVRPSCGSRRRAIDSATAPCERRVTYSSTEDHVHDDSRRKRKQSVGFACLSSPREAAIVVEMSDGARGAAFALATAIVRRRGGSSHRERGRRRTASRMQPHVFVGIVGVGRETMNRKPNVRRTAVILAIALLGLYGTASRQFRDFTANILRQGTVLVERLGNEGMPSPSSATSASTLVARGSHGGTRDGNATSTGSSEKQGPSGVDGNDGLGSGRSASRPDSRGNGTAARSLTPNGESLARGNADARSASAVGGAANGSGARSAPGLPSSLGGQALAAAKASAGLAAGTVPAGSAANGTKSAGAPTNGTATAGNGAAGNTTSGPGSDKERPSGASVADLSREPFRLRAPAASGASGAESASGSNAASAGAPGARGPSQKVVTEEITVSVFGPWGPEGPKKMVQTPRHTGLFEPQPHNPSRGIGVNEQVYRLVAGGREQPKTNPQPITLASGGTMNVDNWNVQVPHRPNIQLAGQAPVEYGTIAVYTEEAYAGGRDPNRLAFRVPTVSEPTQALFFCSIHPTEVRAQLLLLPTDIEERIQRAPQRRGPSHGSSAWLRGFAPANLLADLFGDARRDVAVVLALGSAW
jgi:hypothetical protein